MQRVADGAAAPGDDLPEILGQPCPARQVEREQRRQCRLVVRLLQDGVAGEEGRNGVAGCQAQRVVPRRDHETDAAWVAQLVHRRSDPGSGRSGPTERARTRRTRA